MIWPADVKDDQEINGTPARSGGVNLLLDAKG
jgi:hypothetical protein